jgi:C4-dicarboxylate-specific signal transduction histidine kinase
MAISAAILLQAGLLFWLLYEHRRRSLAEIASRNSMAELTRINRLATVSELSASIAHEINQPLAAMGMYAHAASNWLAAAKPNIAEARNALAQVIGASLRAGDVIKNLRAMFKHDAQNKGPVDVNKVILPVLALVRMEIQKNEIEVRTQLAERLPTVVGVEIQLQQVILNLVMNAIEAMHAATPGPRELMVKSVPGEPDGVRVSIADTGHGFAPSDLERIFQPMFTTKASGMGMGLSICRSIIEAHGGRIWGSAGKNGGAMFEFVLPAS